MTQPDEIQQLVEIFAESVIQQNEAMRYDDYKTGNKHAKQRAAAFAKLRVIGDVGRDALKQPASA